MQKIFSKSKEKESRETLSKLTQILHTKKVEKYFIITLNIFLKVKLKDTFLSFFFVND